MKLILTLILAFCLYYFGNAQNFMLEQGDVVKMEGTTSSFQLIGSDSSGVYVLQALPQTNRLNFRDPYSTVFRLYKFDHNFSVVFIKELGEFDLHKALILNGELFLFTKEKVRNSKTFTIYGARLNKNTGVRISPLVPIVSDLYYEEDDDFRSFVFPITDENSFLVATKITSDDNQTLKINIVDTDLKARSSATFNAPMTSTRRYMDHFVYEEGKLFLFTREYDVIQKKKNTSYTKERYFFQVFTPQGKKEAEIPVDRDGKLFAKETLINHPMGGVSLMGFDCESYSKNETSGFYFQKFDGETGRLEKSDYKEINPSQFVREAKNAIAKFEKNYHIQKVDFDPSDSTMIIFAEHVNDFYRSDRTYVTSTSIRAHLMVINIDKSGTIGWVNLIPKVQTESYTQSIANGATYSDKIGSDGSPYFSSFTSLIKDGKLLIFLNDNVLNKEIQKLDFPLKEMDFKKSSLYIVSIDIKSGAMERTPIAENGKDMILTPRHALVMENEILLPSWRDFGIGTSHFRLGRLTIK